MPDDRNEAAPLPAPMVPADCNLTDFEFMPVMVRRLLKSETWSLGTGDERAAAVALWFESWHQVPAGSLPSDERLQKKLADSDSWRKIKQQALRGWVACSDGRLYHPVVAEKALESWIEKLLSAAAGSVTNLKRWGVFFDRSSMLDKLQDSVVRLQRLNPQSRTLKKRAVVAVMAGVLPGESPPDRTSGSPPDRGSTSPPDPATSRPPMSPPDPKTVATDIDRDRDLLIPIPPTEVGDPPFGVSPTPHPNGRVVNGAIPPCDHEAILALWREILPACPQPLKWTEVRRRHMLARWREIFADGTVHNREEALVWFAKFFRYLAKSEFLTGRVKPRDQGRPPFVAELPWVLMPQNFVHCIEGKYHQQPATT